MLLSWKQRFAVVCGNAMEFYDIAVFAAISPFLINILSSNGYENATFLIWGGFALRFLLRPFGGYLIGKVADHHGEKIALILTSSLTGISTISMAMLPINLEFIAFYFLFLQMLQAFSFGGEYPTIINYLIKHSPKIEIARTSSIIVASSILGVLFSLGIVESLKMILSADDMQNFGWRVPLFIGGVNIAVSFWFRYHLPQDNKTIHKTNEDSKQWLHLFFISVAGAVVFYIQNLSGSILQKTVNIPYFSLINSSLLFIFIIAAGYFTDKLSTSVKSFQIGCFFSAILYVPSYWVLSHSVTEIAVIAMLIISVLSALILANLAGVLANVAKDQTVTLGLCYNVALSIFGGVSPLVVELLSRKDVSFVGLYAALCVLPALIFAHSFAKETLISESV